MHQKLASYLQFLLVLTSLAVATACPSDCSCKWKHGKQSVECLGRGLRTFPTPIDSGTQVLDLAGNSFETLPPDHFMRLGLINLQKIFLSKCRLAHISPRTFRGLSNLVDLDLSSNVMREVPSGAFPDCQGLMRLILSGNPISHIPRNAFISLESLTTLEISYAGIELIEKGAFDGLVSLEWLKLNGNKLKRITGLSSLPLGLKGIWLEENMWECDCHLLELRLWLAERNVANSVEPRCTTPHRLTNSSLKDVHVDNFACLPQLSPTTMYQKIGEGKNVSLLCRVVSVPESTLEWWFNGQPVLNSSLNMLVDTSTTSMSPSTYSSGGSTTSYNSPYSNNNNNNNNHHLTNNYSPTPWTNNNNNNYNTLLNNNNNVNYNNYYNYVGLERKSELLILNATIEENGTFLCLARNPAGVATANFTLKVLTRSDTDSVTESSVTSLVASYSNALVVVVVSTVGVIGVVILLFILLFVLCKCSRLCRGWSSGHINSSSPDGSGGGGGGRRHKQHSSSSRGLKDSKDSNLLGGGKMNRHLSEASTLTTATKSNGSVFLLSTSSELGIGDSNPDLIEGVKRMEGDGHETCFSGSNMNVNNFSNSSVYPQSEPSANPTSHLIEPSSFPAGAVVASTAYPMDYGLPKSLNVATLVRRIPPPSSSSSTSSPQIGGGGGGGGSSSYGTMSHLPPNYDLAKYPKEYINPTPTMTVHSHSLMHGHGHGDIMGPCGGGGGGTVVSHHHMYSTLPHNMNLPDPQSGLVYSGDYYPAFMVAPDGTYLWPTPATEEYFMNMGHGGYGPPPPSSHGMGSVIVSSGGGGGGGGGANCTCAPILEQCDEEKAAMEADAAMNLTTSSSSTATTITNDTSSSSTVAVSTNTGTSTNIESDNNSTSSTFKKRRNETGMVARLQRQLKTQINESPDEGYEDESAEGTEI